MRGFDITNWLNHIVFLCVFLCQYLQCLIRIRADWKYSPWINSNVEEPLLAVKKYNHHINLYLTFDDCWHLMTLVDISWRLQFHDSWHWWHWWHLMTVYISWWLTFHDIWHLMTVWWCLVHVWCTSVGVWSMSFGVFAIAIRIWFYGLKEWREMEMLPMRDRRTDDDDWPGKIELLSKWMLDGWVLQNSCMVVWNFSVNSFLLCFWGQAFMVSNYRAVIPTLM